MGDVPTDPKSVPFLDMAKYRPVLTDLMATTPTLTDRISIRPGETTREQRSGLEREGVSPSKTTLSLEKQASLCSRDIFSLGHRVAHNSPL